MKKLLFSSALTFSSLIATTSAIAGPGEPSAGGLNTINSCNTSVDDCLITPTKFSAKVYQVSLCTSNPMPTSAPPDFEGSGCVDVYKSDTGEETGDIFSDTGATLSAENITIPSAGEYTHVATIFDKDFKAARHHMVYGAGGGPVNNKRYVSTSSGGATEGAVGEEQMMTGEFNTFMPQIECQNDASIIHRTATTGNNDTYKDFLSGGESFYGRILKEDYTLATVGVGNINNGGTSTCLGAIYLLSIVDKATTINANTTGVHVKILAPEGLIRIDQGNGDGVAQGFSTHGSSMAVSVSPINSSE